MVLAKTAVRDGYTLASGPEPAMKTTSAALFCDQNDDPLDWIRRAESFPLAVRVSLGMPASVLHTRNGKLDVYDRTALTAPRRAGWYRDAADSHSSSRRPSR